MVVQGEPREWPPLNPIPATTMGVQRMPSLPWPAFWNLLFLALLTARSTILGFCISPPSMEPTDRNLKLQALEAFSCPHHPKYPVTLSERRLPSASVLVVLPSQSLCPGTPNLVVSWGWWSGWGQAALQTGLGSTSSFALLYSVFGDPCF